MTYLIVQRTPTAPLTLEPCRRRDALLARLFSGWLDDRLAAGVAPESGRLLAARATQLVDLAQRRQLAGTWDEVVRRAQRPRGVFDSRVPVARNTLNARAEIAALARALRSASPPSARDVARARALLTDGASPVYSGAPGLCEMITRLVTDLESPQVAERSLTERS